MSTITTSVDSLPSSIPRLDPRGANWAIFYLRLKRALASKRVWSHFDGSSACPEPMVSGSPTASEQTAIDDWIKEEDLASNLLTQRIPDSTVLRTQHLQNVSAMWAEIVREYTQKGEFAQTDLRADFMRSKCAADGDV